MAKQVAHKMFGDLAAYAGAMPGRAIQAGLLSFSGHVRTVFLLAPPDAAVVSNHLHGQVPDGGTAIGLGLAQAQRALAGAALSRSFVIVITDGENTVGPPPESVLHSWETFPPETRPAVYVVAFDLQARVFDRVKASGVTVLEARHAADLQAVLDKILFEDILVEAPGL